MRNPSVSIAESGRVAPGEHHLLLLWLLFTGVLVFALFVSWQQGFLHTLYQTDRSNISMGIILIYIVVTFHCAKRINYVSNEYNAAQKLGSIIRNQPQSFLNNLPTAQATGQFESVSLMNQYVTDLRKKLGAHTSLDDISSRELIEVYAEKLKGPQEIGWFATDIMLKLGLLGTIIGFIMMLGSVANVTDFDVSTMQNILQLMSSGMGTALYTTMTGLICSMLAAAQYYMLDRSADQILGTMQHLTEVHLAPAFLNTQS
jgi:biopolymer transport protein ExbB/TolQ